MGGASFLLVDYGLVLRYEFGSNKPSVLFYDKDMTERELVEINGLERVYDLGKICWVKYIT